MIAPRARGGGVLPARDPAPGVPRWAQVEREGTGGGS